MVDNANTLLHTLGTPNLGLKDYTWIYGTIYFQMGNQYNIIRDLLAVITLTEYNISKGLRVFGYSGVTEVLKDLQKIHDRMVTDHLNLEEISCE